MGPARGVHIDSYRAEAYGMLYVLQFLKRLQRILRLPLILCKRITPIMVKRRPETRTPEISIMNSESDEAYAALVRDAQQSIASAVTHAHSDNEEAESHRLRQRDLHRIAATYQASDDRENEDAMVKYHDYEILEVEVAIPHGISIANNERNHEAEAVYPLSQTLQPGDSARSPPREIHSDDEEECINFLPESEIQEIAMFEAVYPLSQTPLPGNSARNPPREIHSNNKEECINFLAAPGGEMDEAIACLSR